MRYQPRKYVAEATPGRAVPEPEPEPSAEERARRDREERKRRAREILFLAFRVLGAP